MGLVLSTFRCLNVLRLGYWLNKIYISFFFSNCEIFFLLMILGFQNCHLPPGSGCEQKTLWSGDLWKTIHIIVLKQVNIFFENFELKNSFLDQCVWFLLRGRVVFAVLCKNSIHETQSTHNCRCQEHFSVETQPTKI